MPPPMPPMPPPPPPRPPPPPPPAPPPPPPAAVSATAAGRLLLRPLGDQRLGRQHQRRDRSRVLKRRAHDLGRVDDAGLDQVLVLLGRRVEAERALAVL